MGLQKQILICVLLAYFVNAGVVPAIKVKIDDEATYTGLSSRVTQPATAIDSSGNGYTLWTQMQECIGYNPIVNAIQIVNRAFSDAGILNVHQAPGDLSYWVHDDSVYKKDFGGARYPNSIASGDGSGNGPHICFAAGTSGGAIYEYGGWFSSLWDMPVPIGWANARIKGKQLPDGNILFIGVTINNDIYWKTMTPDLLNVLSQGMVVNGVYYWGFDINGGIAYIFYYDAGLNIYYKTTTNGITWSAQQPYNMVWPNPYSYNIIGWTQMAVTDAGNPLLIFDNWNGNDTSYPYYSKVYVSYASGLPCVEVSSTFGAPDTECFYPTIATGGNKAAVLYCMPRNNEPDSLNWWDFYVVWSTDNGVTWGTPVNYTQSLINRPGLQQLAKRIDTLRNRVYYVYEVDMVNNIDPYWHLMNLGTDPMYICFDYAPYVGIEEKNKAQNLKAENLKLQVLPNIVSHTTQLRLTIPSKQRISLKVYDIVGREVLTIADRIIDAGIHSYSLNTSNLSSGIYFLVLEGEKESKIEKFLIVR